MMCTCGPSCNCGCACHRSWFVECKPQTTATYSPGTVAVATVRGVPNVRVMAFRGGTDSFSWLSSEYVKGGSAHGPGEVTDVRPLVVLDLPDHCIKQVLGDIRWAHSKTHNARLADIADQIEAQTRPPKPEEPTGLGAVVEDADDCKWVHTGDVDEGGQWWYCGDAVVRYADIDAVRILSAGVDQ